MPEATLGKSDQVGPLMSTVKVKCMPAFHHKSIKWSFVPVPMRNLNVFLMVNALLETMRLNSYPLNSNNSRCCDAISPQAKIYQCEEGLQAFKELHAQPKSVSFDALFIAITSPHSSMIEH